MPQDGKVASNIEAAAAGISCSYQHINGDDGKSRRGGVGVQGRGTRKYFMNGDDNDENNHSKNPREISVVIGNATNFGILTDKNKQKKKLEGEDLLRSSWGDDADSLRRRQVPMSTAQPDDQQRGTDLISFPIKSNPEPKTLTCASNGEVDLRREQSPKVSSVAEPSTFSGLPGAIMAAVAGKTNDIPATADAAPDASRSSPPVQKLIDGTSTCRTSAFARKMTFRVTFVERPSALESHCRHVVDEVGQGRVDSQRTLTNDRSPVVAAKSGDDVSSISGQTVTRPAKSAVDCLWRHHDSLSTIVRNSSSCSNQRRQLQQWNSEPQLALQAAAMAASTVTLDSPRHPTDSSANIACATSAVEARAGGSDTAEAETLPGGLASDGEGAASRGMILAPGRMSELAPPSDRNDDEIIERKQLSVNELVRAFDVMSLPYMRRATKRSDRKQTEID
jgi:hypothetical protein